MYDNLLTAAGSTLWACAAFAFATAFVLFIWPRPKAADPNDACTDQTRAHASPSHKTLSDHALRKLFGTGALLVSILLFISSYSVGTLDFHPTFAQESNDEIIAGLPRESLGSPFIVLDEGAGSVSFTARNSDGVLVHYDVSTKPDSSLTGVFAGTWLIIDDADPGTAYMTIDSCTLVPTENGAKRTAFNNAGTRPAFERCADQKTIHIPRIEIPETTE